jgi:hypothetical protein
LGRSPVVETGAPNRLRDALKKLSAGFAPLVRAVPLKLIASPVSWFSPS